MKSVVWIPSKSRPNPSFSQALAAEGIDHVIWVEPQDHEKYAAATTSPHVSFRVLEKNNQGVTYVRQRILDAARDEGVSMWMMDDDINKFFRLHPIREGLDKARRRELLTLREALTEAEEKFRSNDLVYGCFIHNAFGIFGSPGLSFKKMDYGSIWIDGSKFPKDINYGGIKGREDLFLAVQLVLAGHRAATDNDLSVDHKPSADPKAKGGLADWYADWEKNVLPANAELESRLDALMSEYVEKLDDAGKKLFKGKHLYRQYKMAHGPRKGSTDTRPSWSNIIKLRNAVYAGQLDPI